jgi:hypothetical protein
MKWTPGNNIDTKTHSVNEMYSWAVQSNLKDPAKPCPPYHIDAGEEISEADNCQVPTELIFGFGKKIIDTFCNAKTKFITILHFINKNVFFYIFIYHYYY